MGFYDPFNVVADDTTENFSKWREIELKHGRYVFVPAFAARNSTCDQHRSYMHCRDFKMCRILV